MAYPQGNDRGASTSYLAHVEKFVADTPTLIKILSDPMNRTPLEAERTLAESWYRQSQTGHETESTECPTVSDMPQPPFIVPDDSWRREQPQVLHELPWHDDALSEFLFTVSRAGVKPSVPGGPHLSPALGLASALFSVSRPATWVV